MATHKDSLSEKFMDGVVSINTTQLAKTIADCISKRLYSVGSKNKFLGGKTVGRIDTALYTSISEDQYQRLRRGDGVADVAAKLVNLIKKIDEEKKLHHEIDRNFEQEASHESKKNNVVSEVHDEPTTIGEKVIEDEQGIFNTFTKLSLLTRLPKLWNWLKNIGSFVSKMFSGKLGTIAKIGATTGAVVYGASKLSDVIAKGESGGDYDKVLGGKNTIEFGGEQRKLTSMTVGETLQWGAQRIAQDKGTAIGKYQTIHKTLEGLVKTGVVSESDKMSPETQDKLYESLLPQSAKDYRSGKTSGEAAEDRAILDISKVWAAVPVPHDVQRPSGEFGQTRTIRSGQSYYAGFNNNAAGVSIDDMRQALRRDREKNVGDNTENLLKSATVVEPKPTTVGEDINKSSIDYNLMKKESEQNVVVLTKNDTTIINNTGGQSQMQYTTASDENEYMRWNSSYGN